MTGTLHQKKEELPLSFTVSNRSYCLLICLHNSYIVLIFIGYIPDKATSRATCFLSMMSLSFAHVMLRTFSCALLAVTNTRWLIYYLAADMGLFSLYKIVRKDFFYYVNLTGIARLVVTIVEVRMGTLSLSHCEF